jgi:hypothetical protein
MAEPSSEATSAIGMLQTNGNRQIMRIVKPGPEPDTTSSMPNEPEQTSVNTTITAVKIRIRTRRSAGSVSSFETSDMRTPSASRWAFFAPVGPRKRRHPGPPRR